MAAESVVSSMTEIILLLVFLRLNNSFKHISCLLFLNNR